MHWVQQTLADFGRQLGLAHFGLGTLGVAQLRLASGALLAVEPALRGRTEEILIYFSRPLGFEATQTRRAALAKAHYSNNGPYAVQIATRGEGAQSELLMLVRLPQRGFTPQTLSHAVDYLDRWFSELRDGR